MQGERADNYLKWEKLPNECIGEFRCFWLMILVTVRNGFSQYSPGLSGGFEPPEFFR